MAVLVVIIDFSCPAFRLCYKQEANASRHDNGMALAATPRGCLPISHFVIEQPEQSSLNRSVQVDRGSS
jgi:hypothetical protein